VYGDIAMKELNKLTQQLFAQGYTEENYPDWVKPFNSFYGGFTYTVQKLYQLVFSTPCGLLLTGSHFISGHMSFMGIDWMEENDNPVVRCPYDKVGCELNHEILRGSVMGTEKTYIVECACKMVSVEYDYKKSFERVWDERRAEEERLYEEFVVRTKGHCCKQHMYFNERRREWNLMYDPVACARWNHCGEICDLTQKPLNPKKGNVFYDIRIIAYRHDGGLFDGEKVVTISKGNRFLGKATSLTICDEIVKRCKDQITERVKHKYWSQLLHNPDMTIDVTNVRAEFRESRDLRQDLADIRDGIKVIHQSDLDKAAKAQKSERRKSRKEAKRRKLKSKIMKNGYDGLEYGDQIRAGKVFDSDELEELQEHHINKNKSQEQMSLFG
jgi:hypothetical protein